MGLGSGWSAERLVVLGRVDDQGADEFAGGGFGDAYVEVVDEHDDAGAAVLVAEADVVHAPVDSQRDASALVDDVLELTEVVYIWGPL